MKFIRRDPAKGYLDAWLWVPKTFVNVDAIRSALTLKVQSYDGEETSVLLFKEAPEHMLVPRAFWNVESLPFPIVDCRPQQYEHVDFKSRIKLDHRKDEHGDIVDTGEDIQKKAVAALEASEGGILQLACVAGDTVLQLNRGGKGFKMPIQKVWESLQLPNFWDPKIPTLIRANIGTRIGLHKLRAVVFSGTKLTFELKLSDGKVLRLTADHEVQTVRGFIPLHELVVGDQVITDGFRAPTSKTKRIYKRVSWYKTHPYARKQLREGRQAPLYQIELHRVLAEARLNNLSFQQYRVRCKTGAVEGLLFIDPVQFHVHHKDENHLNNELSNLEVLTAAEHRTHHSPGFEAFGYGVLQPIEVVSITRHKKEPVYDVICEDPHRNFVANGIVVHNCGRGKTAVALENIARMAVPAIVVVDNTNLLNQWQQAIAGFLEVPGGVGVVGAGKMEWDKNLIIATYQTLAARAEELPMSIRRRFGVAVWDEGHHVNAQWFCRSLELFYGKRFSLTATPERDDGLHIVAQMHIGGVLYKNLRQMLRARFFFNWTGFKLDLTDKATNDAVLDVTGEVHNSKVTSYFAKTPRWLHKLLLDSYSSVQAGRKVLVLTDSVTEAVNMMTLWTRGPNAQLYSDVPFPTAEEVGVSDPLILTFAQAKTLRKQIEEMWQKSSGKKFRWTPGFEAEVSRAMEKWTQYRAGKKLVSEYARRQRKFVDELIKENSQAGLMTYGVPVEERQRFMEERPVVFAITKYGKEGLDCVQLDTVLVSSIFSSRAGLQQLMGRPTRPYPGKKTPTVVFYVHEIRQHIGMSKKLQRLLRDWPEDESGPFQYEFISDPRYICQTSTLHEVFGS